MNHHKFHERFSQSAIGIFRVYQKMFPPLFAIESNGTLWCYGYVNGGVLQFGVWWPRKIQFWLAGASRKYFKMLLNTSRSDILFSVRSSLAIGRSSVGIFGWRFFPFSRSFFIICPISLVRSKFWLRLSVLFYLNSSLVKIPLVLFRA